MSTKHSFDFANVGKKNQRYSQADKRVVKSFITDSEVILQRVQNLSKELSEQKKSLVKNLRRYRAALVPCHILSDEILGYIFILASQIHGTVTLPFDSDNMPPQLTLSHVCSDWMHIARGTTELWNDIAVKCNDLREPVFRRWLLRAGTRPISLELDFIDMTLPPISFVRTYLETQFRIEKLTLIQLGWEHLRPFREDDLPHLQELHLDLIVLRDDTTVPMVPLAQKIRSMKISGIFETDSILEDPAVPWGNLRSFSWGTTPFLPLPSCMTLLRKMPQLEECDLTIHDADHSDGKVIMTQVKTLTLNLLFTDANLVATSLIFPNLVSFSVRFGWSAGHPTQIYEAFKKSYNFGRLRQLYLRGCRFSLGTILNDAPELRDLSVSDAIVDDDVVEGLSTCRLGRFIISLRICGDVCVGEMLDMLEARHKLATRIIKNSTNCKDDVSIIRRATFCPSGRLRDPDLYEERADALERLGIIVRFSN